MRCHVFSIAIGDGGILFSKCSILFRVPTFRDTTKFSFQGETSSGKRASEGAPNKRAEKRSERKDTAAEGGTAAGRGED